MVLRTTSVMRVLRRRPGASGRRLKATWPAAHSYSSLNGGTTMGLLAPLAARFLATALGGAAAFFAAGAAPAAAAVVAFAAFVEAGTAAFCPAVAAAAAAAVVALPCPSDGSWFRNPSGLAGAATLVSSAMCRARVDVRANGGRWQRRRRGDG